MCYGENGKVTFLEALVDKKGDALIYHPGIKNLMKKILLINFL
jgi:hypothetical protein